MERRGLSGRGRGGARHFEERGNAGTVVHRAVVDAIGVRRRVRNILDAEMIQVRREHHVFARQRRISCQAGWRRRSDW